MNNVIKKTLQINSRFFKYFLELFLILFVINTLEQGFVLRVLHFRLIWLFAFIFISGSIALLSDFKNINAKIRGSAMVGISDEVFVFSLIFYLLLLLGKEFELLFIKKYFEHSLNWLLGLVMVSGAICSLFGEMGSKRVESKAKRADYMFGVLLGVVGAFLIWLKTKGLGSIGYIISAISGLLIILLSVVILSDDES